MKMYNLIQKKCQSKFTYHVKKLSYYIYGSKKYLYDIFGDPVNTASRLESNSETMRIHVSDRTYRLVKDKFNFEEQPPLEVKGKGIMKMYFVK